MSYKWARLVTLMITLLAIDLHGAIGLVIFGVSLLANLALIFIGARQTHRHRNLKPLPPPTEKRTIGTRG